MARCPVVCHAAGDVMPVTSCRVVAPAGETGEVVRGIAALVVLAGDVRMVKGKGDNYVLAANATKSRNHALLASLFSLYLISCI